MDSFVGAKERMLMLCLVNGLKNRERKGAVIQQQQSTIKTTFEETCRVADGSELIQNSVKENGVLKMDTKKGYC